MYLGVQAVIYFFPNILLFFAFRISGISFRSGLMGAIETAKMDFRMMFWNLRLSVNYDYPPESSFESGKREEPFA